MRPTPQLTKRLTFTVALLIMITLISTRHHADTGSCGGQTITVPFTDVIGSIFFCKIAEAYFTALTNGTDPTHYSPSANVTRDQMSAFITRTLDQSLARGSERAALDQFWTTRTADGLGLTSLSSDGSVSGAGVKYDGLDLWVAGFDSVHGGSPVLRVRASTGNLLQTWTGADGAVAILVARGKVFIAGDTNPGSLYMIDPRQPAGAVTTVSTALGGGSAFLAYDGQHIWTANVGSISKVTLNPLTVETFTAGLTSPKGIVFDGTSIWVTDSGDNKLKEIDPNGNVALSVSVGILPANPVFDGANIWVPSSTGSVSVVRAAGSNKGTVLATLSGNGLTEPWSAAFDGEHILIANFSGGVLSLWRATDFSRLGSVTVPGAHFRFPACSDGVNFWITMEAASGSPLLRF